MKKQIKSEKEQVVEELHKPARINYPRRRVIIKGIDDLWQADLAEFILYSRLNKGYKYILVVIDCFSKFVWTVALKNKSAAVVSNAFKQIINKSKRKPVNFQTDLGKEFFNSMFNQLVKSNGINHYNTYSVKKASIVERVIRTLKSKLYRMFNLRGMYKYYEVLDKITAEYNNQKHSTIRMKPSDVDKSNEQSLLDTVYSHVKIAGKRKFKIGDIVRISKQKSDFAKGYTPNWSTELFKIYAVKISNPVVYYLEDMKGNKIAGAFYEEEMQLTKHEDIYLVEKVLRRKGNQLFVKWLGLDKSHNSWISKISVVK